MKKKAGMIGKNRVLPCKVVIAKNILIDIQMQNTQSCKNEGTGE